MPPPLPYRLRAAYLPFYISSGGPILHSDTPTPRKIFKVVLFTFRTLECHIIEARAGFSIYGIFSPILKYY
jgi:hypothetical protein